MNEEKAAWTILAPVESEIGETQGWVPEMRESKDENKNYGKKMECVVVFRECLRE
jgi:hypothetical protein